MTQSSIRAGQYVRQATGYRSFVPSTLPPVPGVTIDDELLDLLSRADRALGRLDGATEALPNPDLFVMMYVRKEAVLSSQIEGTQASLTDLLALEAQALESGRPFDVAELANYVAAMDHGLRRLSELPLSLRLLREVHGILMKGTRGGELTPGEFRTSQNWIGPTGCTLATARFVPPAPGDMVAALGELELFLHDESPMPLLLRVGLAHAQFETIHPFLDGNGRLGRLLITFLLCERQVLDRPLLYLSNYLKANRQEYYDRLQAVRDRGEWEAWLKFFLRGVAEVANEATVVARKVVALREEDRDRIVTTGGRTVAEALKLHEQLFDVPFVTLRSVAVIIGKEEPAAGRLMTHLERLGILREMTGRKRRRVYHYERYFKLFDDGGTVAADVYPPEATESRPA